MRRRIILKLTETEQEQLNFVTGCLRVRPEDFLRSVIPVHFNELNRMLNEGLAGLTGPRAPEKLAGEVVDEPAT
jgi:hypothetical protein